MNTPNKNKKRWIVVAAYVSFCAALVCIPLILFSQHVAAAFWIYMLATICALVFSFYAVRVKIVRRKKRIMFKIIKYLSIVGIVIPLSGIIIIIAVFWSAYNDDLARHGHRDYFTVEEIIMEPVPFGSYNIQEVESMQGLWMRGGAVVDSCYMADVSEKEGIVYGALSFRNSWVSDEIFVSDTIFFRWGDNVHKIYNIGWREIHKDGKYKGRLGGFDLMNGNNPSDVFRKDYRSESGVNQPVVE